MHQICVIHKYRNVLKKVRVNNRKKFLLNLKEVFNNFESSDSIKNTKLKLFKFLNKWKSKYPFLRNCFKQENLNKQIRKATKNKLSFESPKIFIRFCFYSN